MNRNSGRLSCWKSGSVAARTNADPITHRFLHRRERRAADRTRYIASDAYSRPSCRCNCRHDRVLRLRIQTGRPSNREDYEMFIAQLPSATDAAILLPDWSRSLTGAKLVPAFGGYFGLDAGRPVFVFAKGAWIAGIAGLPEKEADAQARILAGQIE